MPRMRCLPEPPDHIPPAPPPACILPATHPARQVNSTPLYFPKPLSAIYGNAMQWSYAGGFLK